MKKIKYFRLEFFRVKYFLSGFYYTSFLEKTYIVFLCNLFIVILVYLLTSYCLTDVLLCDSVSDIGSSNIENENSPIDRVVRDVPSNSLGLWSLFRRRLYWYFRAGNSKDFSSYEDFKESWNPDNSLRYELKVQFKRMMKDPLGDFREARAKAQIDRDRSREAAIRASESLASLRRAQAKRRIDSLNYYSSRR